MPLLLEAIERLEKNSGNEDLTSVFEGIIDAQDQDSKVDTEVAELVLRAVVDYGQAANWPVDMISDESSIFTTLPRYQNEPASFLLKRLSSRDFGIALGHYLPDTIRERLIIMTGALSGQFKATIENE
ncbi:MAG: hypothetical protein EOT05_02135 [Candidatus Microsaccharimonas sossegonensis]|uniref:Uncharacterized protein n=1 Tax=Candidatus Microsaccharimonas sossegonensis TaxID=2506948 RepID=A0A4Q0AIP1_9BACT|nr:MAG: hypothetical protein EOT05_02135 [Candidatus Microsaccharimonas sossegonensis]